MDFVFIWATASQPSSASAMITRDESESSNVSPKVLKRVIISEPIPESTTTLVLGRRQRGKVVPTEWRGAFVIGLVHPYPGAKR